MTDPNLLERIPADQAAAVLHRAAELQVAALQRREDRSLRQLREACSPEAGVADGFARAELRDAAVSAGISAEHLDRALSERDALGIGHTKPAPPSRFARHLLGPDPGWLEVSRSIDASPETVLGAMQRVFPSDRYRLALRDTVGTDPLSGAVLVFDVPSMTEQYGGAGTFAYEMAWANVGRLLVSLSGETGTGCTISICSDLSGARRSSASTAVVLGSLGAAGGGVGGYALAGSVFALAGAAVALPAVAAAGAVGWVVARTCRATYEHGLGRARRALDELLRIVEVHARAPAGFTTPAPQRQRPPDDDVATALLGTI